MTVAMSKFIGKPDGPAKYMPELGMKVGTFTTKPGGKFKTLSHHVPLEKRGLFHPEDLANYDIENEYRTDRYGFVLCYAISKATGVKCKKRAVNRYPRCNVHGGRLHPLDKLADNLEEKVDGDVANLTRYQQFVAGIITIDDLDDEEITSLGFRDRRGYIRKPKNVPRDMVTVFTRAIYDRSLNELKTSTLEAAKTLATIMMDPSNDVGIRFKAAEAILDRSLGKAPQLVAITGSAPWEEIFEGIAGGSREQSRRQRGAEILDVESDEIQEISGA